MPDAPEKPGNVRVSQQTSNQNWCHYDGGNALNQVGHFFVCVCYFFANQMCQEVINWTLVLLTAAFLGASTTFLTVSIVNVPYHDICGSQSNDSEISSNLLLISLLGLATVALLTFSTRYRSVRSEPLKVVRRGQRLLAVITMYLGVFIGLLLANGQLVDQSNQLNTSYYVEVHERQKRLFNAPQQCAQQLASESSAWAVEPCASCNMPEVSYLPDAFSHWIIWSQNDAGYNEWTYLTQREPLDAIVCYEQLSQYSPGIWSAFASLDINETAPQSQCLNVQMDYDEEIARALMGYAIVLEAWVPMQTIVVNLSLSTGDCVRVEGWVSKRWFATDICGQGNPVDPRTPGAWPLEFANCSSPALKQFHADYLAHIQELQIAIGNVTKPYVYDRKPLDIVAGVGIAACSALILITLSFVCIDLQCEDNDEERQPLKTKESKASGLYPSVN
jgi:hypothetical protein